MIKGHANLKGTREYFARNLNIRTKKTPWFEVSRVALGTHLGEMTEEDSKLYRESLSYAFTNGINFTDTAINYRGMRSERDIGRVISRLIKNNSLKRGEFVLSTKAGLVPGDIEAKLVPNDYLQEILLKHGIIAESDLNIVGHRKHVMAPSYYGFAMNESRKHLNVETIDIYYIHNPEVSMMVLGPKAFYEKLIELFVFLEQTVREGKIRFYGIASWDGFLVSPSDSSYLSLEEVTKAAEIAGGKEHHFKFVQFPLNERRVAAIDYHNQSVSSLPMPTLKAAKELGLYSMTSAPLELGKLIGRKRPPSSLLTTVMNTHHVHSVMVGMKHVSSVKSNIQTILKKGG
ncbi:aldo/keto reductase [Rossellomorea aquimaris]|uniref:aldo/keto reductase n=1 Tax=Rossellomorea aquimaris TaxID=189382 RepID=UPI001CD3EE8F|nr:aldo/keto reductase [Rossellomorea aquimaris]MCA1053761.1 aldo/keto reductase [Rossellomorea aquimaris]